jgi:hypothetical protein
MSQKKMKTRKITNIDRFLTLLGLSATLILMLSVSKASSQEVPQPSAGPVTAEGLQTPGNLTEAERFAIDLAVGASSTNAMEVTGF